MASFYTEVNSAPRRTIELMATWPTKDAHKNISLIKEEKTEFVGQNCSMKTIIRLTPDDLS